MQGAYKVIADINPVSHLVEGVRGLVIDGLTARHVAAALLVPLAIGAFSIALAMRTLYSRLAAR
jgi:ABC-type polysaccharide/polyol phosphate export permease